MTTTSRPLRADARRNREKILLAARQAFGADGRCAQMEDIAGLAGVGVGTLYRHFPTKAAIVRQLVFDHMSTFAELGEEILADPTREPWEALSGWLWGCARSNAEDRALAQVLSQEPPELPREVAIESGLFAVGEQIIARAREAGAVRPDASVEDIPLIMCGLGAVLQSRTDDEGWQRYLTLTLDGLRAGAR